MFPYEAEDESSSLTPENRFKTDFFLTLVDQALESVIYRVQKTHDVDDAFSFLFTQEYLLHVHREDSLLQKCQHFQERMGDVDPHEMEMELKRFVQM